MDSTTFSTSQASRDAGQSTWQWLRNRLSSTASVGGQVLIGLAVIILLPVWATVIALRWAFKRLSNLGRMKRTLLPLAMITSGAFAFSIYYATDISGLAVLPLKAVMGVSLFYVIVRYGDSINTIKALEEGNEAVSSHYRSYALIIAAALLGL